MVGWLALLRKLFLPPLLAVALAALLAPLLFLGATDLQPGPRYRPDGGDKPPSPLVNLAATALFRAGFIRISPEFEDPGDEAEPARPARARWDAVGLPHACTDDPVVKALVAAEVYMRPAWRRQMEMALAEGWFALIGQAPDWSYGMAQVRLSTARQAITQAQRDHAAWLPPKAAGPDLSDRGLLDLLADPCNAIRIATLVADGPRRPGDSAATIATRYRGAPSREALPGVVTYERLVSEMAERMLPGLTSPTVLDDIWIDPTQSDLDLTLADLRRPDGLTLPVLILACLPSEGEVMAGGWLYAQGTGDDSGGQPVSASDFTRALAALDPRQARLAFFVPPEAADPYPVPDASLASLAALAEIDAIFYPGLLRHGWAEMERRLADESLPCPTGFGILSAMPPDLFRDMLGLRPLPDAPVAIQ